jgi:ATP-dependent DNA helicase PIF1
MQFLLRYVLTTPRAISRTDLGPGGVRRVSLYRLNIPTIRTISSTVAPLHQVMLQRAANRQVKPVPAPKPALQKQLFPSSSPSSTAASYSQVDGERRPQYNPGSSQNPIAIGIHTANSALENLHHGVHFDENDFDDDIDLEDTFNIPTITSQSSKSQPIKPVVSNARQADAKFPPTSKPLSAPRNQLPSSAPLDWSSSPPHQSESIRNPLEAADLNKQKRSSPDSESGPQRIKKRRTLPWHVETNEAMLRKEKLENSAVHREPKGLATPASNISKFNYQPWNTTPGALEQQQKEMRQANKKLTRDTKGTAATKEEALKKKKHHVNKIFLSEEQRKVLKLVVDGGKSVFFTGSAGKQLYCKLHKEALK